MLESCFNIHRETEKLNRISDFVQTLKSLQAAAQTAPPTESVPQKIDAQYEKFIEDKKNAERATRQHKEEVACLQRKIKEELEPQQNQYLTEIARLKAAGQTHEDALQARNARIRELETQRNALRTEAKQYQQNCQQAQNKARHLQQQIKEDLESQRNQYLTEINSLTAEKRTCESKIESQDGEIASQNREIIRMKTKMQDVDRTNSRRARRGIMSGIILALTCLLTFGLLQPWYSFPMLDAVQRTVLPPSPHETELAAIRTTLQETDTNLATARTDLSIIQTALHTKETELITMQDILRKTQSELSLAQDALSQRETAVTDLAQVRLELETAHSTLASAQAELASVRLTADTSDAIDDVVDVPDSLEDAIPTLLARVNATPRANLRLGPSTNTAVRGTAVSGSSLVLVGWREGPDGDGIWYQLDSGLWIWGSLVADIPADVPQLP